MRLRTLVGVLCLLGLWLCPTAVRADPQQDLDLATSRFDNARYEEAAQILEGLLSIEADPDTPEGKQRLNVYLRARPYYAASLIALSKPEEAAAVILDQYRADPFYELPPGQFPQAVADKFIEVAAIHRKQIEQWQEAIIQSKQAEAAQKAALEKARADRLAKLEAMAAEERTVTSRTRWLAMVPFGVGQFQNENIGLGIFFATSETLAIGTTIVSYIIGEGIKNTRCPAIDPETGQPINCTPADGDDNLEDQFEVARVVNWVAFGTSVALIVGGIIEAQLSFEEDRVQTRKRPIPPPVTVAPSAGLTPDGEGAVLGVEVRF